MVRVHVTRGKSLVVSLLLSCLQLSTSHLYPLLRGFGGGGGEIVDPSAEIKPSMSPGGAVDVRCFNIQ